MGKSDKIYKDHLDLENIGLLTHAELEAKIEFLENNTVGDHNDLSNIQGGTSTERYHLTQAEYSLVQNFATTVLNTVLTGISFISGTAVVATDTILVAIGKLQKQISDLFLEVSGKENTGIAASLISDHEGEPDPHPQYATDTDLNSHVGDTNNPHSVTKSQVDLSNVDNTSDVNKPVSTAQQTALNLKFDNANVVDEDNMVSNSDTRVPTQQSVVAYVATALTSASIYKGTYNASTNTPDLTTAPNAIKIGHYYECSVAGTFFGEALEIGDRLTAKIDSPSSLANWGILQTNLDAPRVKTLYESNADTNAYTDAEKTKLAGIEALAEVNNISDANALDLTDGLDSTLHFHAADRNRASHTGTQLASTISDFSSAAKTATVADSITDSITDVAPSQNAVFDALALKQNTITGAATTIVSSNLTASRALASDVSGKVSVATTTLTELNFVNGVTSAIQTQLNEKEPTIMAGTTLQYWRGDKSWQTLDKTAVGLDNVDNTSDANKPVSTATQTALNLKLGESFETVNKNLKAFGYTLNYTSGKLTSIVYTNSVTKTLNYSGDTVTSIVLSGAGLPSGITLTKTLNYTVDTLTSIAYS